MKSISIIPGTTTITLVDQPEPEVVSPDDIKVHVLQVGICGTDREEVAGGRALAMAGQNSLVIGHEMFSRVVQVGSSVKRVKPGDYAVFTVRRGCGECLPCAMNRSDMCRSGKYHERGIWGLNGYQSAFVVDKEQYVVQVPPELAAVGVLCEPLSVAEKAIDEAIRLQTARLPDSLSTPDWLKDRPCLVAGIGPIGLLAALALRLRGAEVYGLDIVDQGTPRVRWLESIGGQYIDGRQVNPENMTKVVPAMDLILDATGVPSLELNLLDVLNQDGIYTLTGIPGGNRPIEIQGSEIIRRMVLDNQVMFGSVNASRDHFQMAVNDLEMAQFKYGNLVQSLITHRFSYLDFASAFAHHADDEIKAVIDWSEAR
jgi:threonine dehydrogenase-like Zn-dependent dehydrogenase